MLSLWGEVLRASRSERFQSGHAETVRRSSVRPTSPTMGCPAEETTAPQPGSMSEIERFCNNDLRCRTPRQELSHHHFRKTTSTVILSRDLITTTPCDGLRSRWKTVLAQGRCTARVESNGFALTQLSIAPKIDRIKSRVTLFPPLVRPVKTQLNRRYYEMARCGTRRGDAMGLSR
jgi:hypothetical protein